jgi:RNase P subunit RPR2
MSEEKKITVTCKECGTIFSFKTSREVTVVYCLVCQTPNPVE